MQCVANSPRRVNQGVNIFFESKHYFQRGPLRRCDNSTFT